MGSRSPRKSPSATVAVGLLEGARRGLAGAGHQRCWVRKTANVLNKVTLSVQTNMKDLRVSSRHNPRGGE